MTANRKPLLHGDLFDAAAALLLAQDSHLISEARDENAAYAGESSLMAAREAASRYLCACFDYCATAFEADDDAPENGA